jgi:hypothetical protein
MAMQAEETMGLHNEISDRWRDIDLAYYITEFF